MSDVIAAKLSPQVLKNRGVPVRVHVLEQDAAGRWARSYEADGQTPVTEQVWIQLTNDVLASIEEHWGSLDEWQKASQTKPFLSIGATLAICFDWWKDSTSGEELPDGRRGGRAMLDGSLEVYTSAVGAAFMLANGIAPDRVGKALTDGLAATQKARARLVDETMTKLDEATAEAETLEAHESELAEPAAPATSTRRKSAGTGRRGSASGSPSDGPSTSSGA